MVLSLIPDKDKKLKFVDLGTGSGCLIISILNEYKYSEGIGIDISKEAIKLKKLLLQQLRIYYKMKEAITSVKKLKLSE